MSSFGPNNHQFTGSGQVRPPSGPLRPPHFGPGGPPRPLNGAGLSPRPPGPPGFSPGAGPVRAPVVNGPGQFPRPPVRAPAPLVNGVGPLTRPQVGPPVVGPATGPPGPPGPPTRNLGPPTPNMTGGGATASPYGGVSGGPPPPTPTLKMSHVNLRDSPQA